MRRFWIGLIVVLAVSFGVLGFVGSIYQLAPPIPDRVVGRDGAVVFEPGQVAAGQTQRSRCDADAVDCFA